MLPLQQSYEVKHSVIEYLKATFIFKDKKVNEAFYQFINDKENGIFKGPYVSLKLPFVKSGNPGDIPLEIQPNFPPYDHQFKSFQRLKTTDTTAPQSTLITTGTSSGKTECFLYPILDYCYKNLYRQGIKVIILYPMNALATDQAKRLAETIWNDERLKGKITAGLFIGEGKDKKKYPKDMGEDHIIENRDSIIDSPPDILLTNFKMLDYALMRNNFHNLWNFNLEDPSLLQFLVLDELHTYDGAQGTDVANLIRRLKLKLSIEKGQICAVGTSATIGSGDESKQLLIDYAQKVFGEDFDAESVITENRVGIEDFFEIEDDGLDKYIPRQIGLLESRLKENETYINYINRQKRLWQLPESTDETNLGEELKKLKLVKDLISLTTNSIKNLDILIRELADINPDFRRLPEYDAVNDLNSREEVINSLLALISEAKVGNEKKFPFLYLQIQLWVRELSGVLRVLGNEPKFTWKDNVGKKYDPKSLPAYFCRDCGSSGWLGIKDDNKNHFYEDPKQVYDYYFDHHKNLYFINTLEHKHIEEYEPTTTINDYLNKIDLSIHDKPGEGQFKIHAVRKLSNTKSRHTCPECNTENNLGIIGTKVATLSSITVSQILASDLDPRPEQSRKILAFTNSVQDAAHQAGFVEARNYRFTFRSSLQKVINQINAPLNLNQLQVAFIDYWKNNSDESGNNLEDAYYYRFFPADYKGRVDLDNDYRNHKKFTDAFKHEFDERMRWEISSEYGYNATIGRTLEKTGASAIKFNETKLKLVYPLLKEWLDANNLSMISEEDLFPFMNGILHRIRTRGGVDHEYLSKFRNTDLKLWDLNWMRDNRHFLNKMYHPNSRFPRLMTIEPHSRGLLDSTFTNTSNWYRNYYLKSFLLASPYPPIVNEFYKRLFEVFTELGIMNKTQNHPNENYAIEPSVIIVENKVKHLACDSCGSVMNVAFSDNISHQTLCLDYTCKTGKYIIAENGRPNYYQLVYNRNRSPRIYASEHTGILERKARENIEIDFKKRPSFNSLNTIVSTSTLEMGIDIGTLNSAINNSVPPLTSNFLQRVGRAGRSSGSALITNFAQNKPHDLFYYHEPSDMMEGDIATPGCFLDAKDILYRHFFAYCLDNWSTADPKNHSIPGRLISMRLLTADLNSPEFLINRIISFIKSNETQLLDRFINFYQNDLEDARVLESLRSFLIEESFYIRLKRVFDRLKKEYQNIFTKRKEIDEYIKANKLPDTDIERKELENEKKALWGLKRLLDKRSILEHMTNVGLLPNYAFPETGVTLNARVKSLQAKASDGIPSDEMFEIVRSSNVALREFAPGNYFYSQGYKFSISGLNTFDWNDPGILAIKRFCSNCDHIADAAISNEPTCPKCGDSSWSSIKNQHVFVKISSVKSVNTKEKATLDDHSEDRDSSFYKISTHVKFDYDSFQGAWGMKDIPFGIEYVKNVDITQVNLGLSSVGDANRIIINNHENVPWHGFVTCKHCGKSSSEPNKINHDPNLKFHFGYCKHKDKIYQGVRDEVFEEVYLFKEIKTEALKVLLPVQEFESEAQVKMFKAGLELGLKKYYKGNPQHLNIVDYKEFNVKNSRFDKYLVIYDTIPGGTGYLEKLFNPADFTEVIFKAYNSIKECSCQFKGQDGCYRCIFTYSNQSVQEELSRKKAEVLFKKIVDKSNVWESFKTGLGSLSGSGQIEESELEERFIRSLRNYILSKSAEGWDFEEITTDGIVNYKCKMKNGNKTFFYFIRPQLELGSSDGVRYRTVSDFYITLTGIEIDGLPVNDSNILEETKDIAIYLDGYTYHATKENQRFYNDVQKRMAVLDSGNRLTWTMSWSDIERFDSTEQELKRDSLFLNKQLYKNTIKTYERIPYWNAYKSELFECRNSFERLIWQLSNPLSENAVLQKIGLYLSLRQIEFGKPSADESEILEVLKNPFQLMDGILMAKNKVQGKFYIFPENPIVSSDFVATKIGVKVADLTFQSKIGIKQVLDNLDKTQWEYFWQQYNLIQHQCELVTEEAAKEIVPDIIEPDKYECLKYHDEELYDIVKQLIDNDIPFERDGGFIVESNGKFAEAMLGFHEPKIVIRPLSNDDKKIFKELGYKEIEPSNFNLNDILK